MSAEHTPTPWGILEECDNALDIVDADGDRIATITDDSDEISERTRADAAFIVRAVNAHDDLVALLREAHGLLGVPVNKELRDSGRALRVRIVAALAKAAQS